MAAGGTVAEQALLSRPLRESEMSRQALFYDKVVPLNTQRHRELRLEHAGFGFAAKVNAVLLTASEFARATQEFPVVFVEEGGAVQPVAVLGLRQGENLFVDETGLWGATYVPAYVRRYPFIMYGSPDGGKHGKQVVCIDDGYAGFSQEKGERLFLDDGSQSPYLQGNIRFLQQYQRDFEQTRQVMRLIHNAGLLEPMQANVEMKGGSKLQVQGFLTINRARLKELKGDALAELHRSDALELIYLHLASLNIFSRLVDRFAAVMGSAAAA